MIFMHYNEFEVSYYSFEINTLFSFLFESFISDVRFQGYNQGAGTEAGGSFRGGHVDRGGYHGHRPYGRPYVPR